MDLVIEGVAVVLAIGALLFQPRREPLQPPSWSNLNSVGRIVLLLILVAGAVKIARSRREVVAQERARDQQRRFYEELQTRNAALVEDVRDLRSQNSQLIKVMSVADGYAAHLHGVVTFENSPSMARVEDAIRNLFLKYVSVRLEAKNKLGRYRGRVDHGTHPEVFRYLNVARLDDSTPLLDALPQLRAGSASFYFDVRCDGLKILNDAKIQYAQLDATDPPVTARLQYSPSMWRDFRSLYGVSEVFVDRITIEELGDIRLAQRVGEAE